MLGQRESSGPDYDVEHEEGEDEMSEPIIETPAKIEEEGELNIETKELGLNPED